MPMIAGSGRLQPALEFGRRRLGDAERRGGRVRIGRRDVAEAQVVADLQRGGELHAARDRMVEPDLDEALADGERDEALRRLARNAELAGDLVLRVAGDVIEPARARRLVEPQIVLIRLARHQPPFAASGAGPPRDDLRQPRHVVENEVGARRRQFRRLVRAGEVAAADKAEHRHAGGARGRDPATLSSITRQSRGAAPIERAANRKRSGWGLPR